MTGTVCLQGGGEFSVGCRAMDSDLARQAGGPVVVAALAGTVGGDYRTATENGVRHFRALGTLGAAGALEVVGAPDVREDPAGALAVLRTARLLVLPGGSPSRLLEVLQTTGVGDVVAQLLADGGTVMGSSAGAMVLGAWTVLPDRRSGAGMQVVPGLGLVPDVLVIPHWSGGSSRDDWLQVVAEHVPPEVVVLGIPEESGVLVAPAGLTAVGSSPTTLVREQRDVALGEVFVLRRSGTAGQTGRCA